MPGRRTHMAVGLTGGVLAAGAAVRRTASKREMLLEALGGAVGGAAGSLMPDRIDPPGHYAHRSFGHAVLPALLFARVVAPILPRVQGALRAEAARQAQLSHQANSCAEARDHAVAADLCHLLNGIIVGALAGYASHLVLDASTPMGLPLLK